MEGNLNRLLELKKWRNSVLPIVRVSYVMQEENKYEQEEFFEKWKDKVDIIDYQCLIDYKDWNVLKEPEELPLPEIDFQCLNPFREILINYNGDIFPCCNNYGYYMPIGNIMEIDLVQAWNSDKMKGLRNSILNKSLCKVCRNCVAHNSIQ